MLNNCFVIENSIKSKLKLLEKLGHTLDLKCWKAVDEWDFMELISNFLDIMCMRY
jgi:hypothetical protein